MGMCDPAGYQNQQEQMKAAADAALAAQYRQIGKEPPDHCKTSFIEGEFEVVDEKSASVAAHSSGWAILQWIGCSANQNN